MPHTSPYFTSSELEKELESPYFCGSCNKGLSDLEEAKRHHFEDEEHLYHVERRIKVMCPGLGICPACYQMCQNFKNWESHVITDKHKKCSETLIAIGKPGDYYQPLGCSSPGVLSGPIDHTKIDVKIATTNYGYGKPFNCTGIPIIGLNYVVACNNDNTKSARFKCGTCEAEFMYRERQTHLASVKHRRFYLKKHYREWFNVVTATAGESQKYREKDLLMFYAHKVELLEKDAETPVAKQLRERFFGIEKHLRLTVQKTKERVLRQMSSAKKDKKLNHARTLDSINNEERIRNKYYLKDKFEQAAKRSRHDPPYHGYDPYSNRGPEMDGPGPGIRHIDQIEMREAMEAINVLERFSMRQAEQEIREKMDTMRDAVMRGARLSEIQGYGAMMSSMTRSGPDPRDRMDRFSPPPRGGFHIPNDRRSRSPGFLQNELYRPGPARPGPPGPILQEDLIADDSAGPYRP